MLPAMIRFVAAELMLHELRQVDRIARVEPVRHQVDAVGSKPTEPGRRRPATSSAVPVSVDRGAADSTAERKVLDAGGVHPLQRQRGRTAPPVKYSIPQETARSAASSRLLLLEAHDLQDRRLPGVGEVADRAAPSRPAGEPDVLEAPVPHGKVSGGTEAVPSVWNGDVMVGQHDDDLGFQRRRSLRRVSRGGRRQPAGPVGRAGVPHRGVWGVCWAGPTMCVIAFLPEAAVPLRIGVAEQRGSAWIQVVLQLSAPEMYVLRRSGVNSLLVPSRSCSWASNMYDMYAEVETRPADPRASGCPAAAAERHGQSGPVAAATAG